MDYYGPMLLFNRFSILVLCVLALAANAQTPDAKVAEPLSSALDSELFYQLLLGELNARNGEPGVGYSLMLDAARKTNDERLYQRAVDIALKARSGESALKAARDWKLARPNSRDANRYVLQILIGLNRVGEALEPLKQEISSTNSKERASFLTNLPRLFVRTTDKKLAATMVERALADYLTTPMTGAAAWTAIGRMRLETGDSVGAMEAVRKALVISPASIDSVLLALSMMGPKTPQAEALVQKYLDRHAQPEVRMAYARALIEAQRYAQAQVQLQTVTAEQPDFPQAWLILGALELQDGKSIAAEKSLKHYLELVLAKQEDSARPEAGPGLVQAYLSLAQIAEQRNDFTQADDWLQRIDGVDDRLNAQLRRASLLARQGKLDEALILIRSQPARSPAEVRLKVTAEVLLLRDRKQYQTAYDLLAQATARDPEDADLLYDMAMMAEKLNKFDEMERLLRQVMAAKPDYQHVYNALGYSLAERKIRLDEARQLVLKALELAPGDPFILDSLGWVEFHSGNLPEALRILEEAFKDKPDVEIAAHLGEVLWAMGQREKAISIWQQGLKTNPSNETLLQTLKRLQVVL